MVDVADIDVETFDLSVKNPNKNGEVVLREPGEILEEMEKIEVENKAVLEKLKKYLI
ncbi:MAG: hypothetical protein M0Q94_14280 [Candidatus Cloacimonetes bacterium]|nr:hypothetical protein [Candidatus Cloacimonadota bacterium]